MDYEFKPELLEYRHAVMEVLAAAGYRWLADYRSIDLDHEDMFLEVDGIRDEDRARGITRVVAAKFKWGIRVYQREYGDQDWVVQIRVLDRGVVFGGSDDGQQSEVSANAPDDDRQQNPLAAPGGQKMKRLAPEELLERFGIILQKFSRRTYVPVIYLPATVRSDGSADHWDGLVSIFVRLRDVRLTIGQFRQVQPLLRTRPDLVDLLGEAILVARRDWLEWFVANLPPGAACRYEPLAIGTRNKHHGLKIISPPSNEKSWGVLLSVHCSAISEVLSHEMQRVAAEGEQ
jgi:hypothetical protein